MSKLTTQHLEIKERPEVVVVRFTAKNFLDREIIRSIREELGTLAEYVGARDLILDFSHVRLFSSRLLAIIAHLEKTIRAAGGDLTICNVTPAIYEVFEITKLSKVFRFGRWMGDDDSDSDLGGAGSRVKPPKPSGGQSAV